MKTFEQCCDEVMNKHNCNDFASLMIRYSSSESILKITKEIAQLWRDEGIREAVKLAREQDYSIGLGELTFKYTEQEIINKLKI